MAFILRSISLISWTAVANDVDVETPLLVESFNLYDTIHIRGVRNLVSGKVINSSPQELEVEYGENSYLFVYRFGCLVFVNVPAETRDREMDRLKSALGPGLKHPTTESYAVKIEDGPTKVEFEYMTLKKPTADHLRLIAVTVGRSAALEYFELRADRLVSDTTNLLSDLSRAALPWRSSRKLLQIIGSTATARQHIISNVAVLDAPELTWKSKELERLYHEIQENFDIEVRFRVLDRKLTLIQDNIEILADLTASRRSTFLETLIVALIVFEIILAFLGPKH